MSGKCYSIEEVINQNELKSARQVYPENLKTTNDSGLHKLLEYEKLASLTEEKCVILRSELERVKQMYNNRHKTSQNSNNNKPQTHHSKEINHQTFKRDKPVTDNIELHPLEQIKQTHIGTMRNPYYKTTIRQNSNAIGTDMSSGPMNTVNNIIDGITESIHFPDLPTQMKKQFTNSTNFWNSLTLPVLRTRLSRHQTRLMNQTHGVQDIKLNTKKYQQPSKSSKNVINSIEDVLNNTNSQNVSRNAIEVQQLLNMRPKRLLSNYSSKTLTGKKYNKKIERKFKQKDSKSLISTSLSLVGNKRTRKTTSCKRPRHWPKISTNHLLLKKPSDLVEIYHNFAVKDSHSSEYNNIVGRNKLNIVPPLNINSTDPNNYGKKDEYNFLTRRALTTISRNYELPTIASRLKQVAKYYFMHQSKIRVIPFCATSSTSPSHNIGINIQQVMNMVKTKQTFKQISPVLVHNIGLAADRWKNKPLPFLINSLTSRTDSLCPLMKTIPNYKQMQEMAKLIPEQIIEETIEETPKISESFIVTGPSGDMKITKRAESVWTATTTNTERCTCLPEKGVNLQQMMTKYKTNYAGSTIGSQVVKLSPTQNKSKINYAPKSIKPEKVKSKDKKIQENVVTKDQFSNNKSKSEIREKQTENKEKKLKSVLIKLHDEFETMQKRYEELTKQTSTDLSQEQLKEINRLDNEMNGKEEEIVMVMGLYEEVLALKKQVKNLKQHETRDLVVLKKDKSLNNYNNSVTIMHLHKLLKQVQYYQNRFKQN